MRIAICSAKKDSQVERLVKAHGFQIVKNNPDVVICFGGDGTILYAERLYPSVPKIPIKTTRICRKCDLTFQRFRHVLERLKEGKFKIKREMKLQATFKGKKMIALNEIQIHTKYPIKAVRFSIFSDEKKFENLIGDGVIIATPFGSTAYYQSTGGVPFKKGIGISFNNLYPKRIPGFAVGENSKVRIKILRERAYLIADNSEKFYEMKPGDQVIVSQSKGKASFVCF
jgi:NAD+ kinase